MIDYVLNHNIGFCHKILADKWRVTNRYAKTWVVRRWGWCRTVVWNEENLGNKVI